MSTRSTVFSLVSNINNYFAIKQALICMLLLATCLSSPFAHKEVYPADTDSGETYFTNSKSPVSQEGLPAIMIIIAPFIEPKTLKNLHLIIPVEEEKSKQNLFFYKSLKIENIYLLVPFIHSP